MLAKFEFAAAAQIFGDGHRHVIGRKHDDSLDRHLDRDRLALLEEQFGRLLLGRVERDFERRVHGDLALLERIKQHVQGHHLGERCRVPQRTLVAGIQGRAGAPIDDKRGILFRIGRTARGACSAKFGTILVQESFGVMSLGVTSCRDGLGGRRHSQGGETKRHTPNNSLTHGRASRGARPKKHLRSPYSVLLKSTHLDLH